MSHDELELLTIVELARLWRLSTRTIQRRIKAGEIPVVTIGGRRRISAVDAARIAAAGTTDYREGHSTPNPGGPG